MTSQHDRNARKFAEPRSWAAKWCGYGLTGRRERPTAKEFNGRKFAEPRGWAAKWCNGGLGARSGSSGAERAAD